MLERVNVRHDYTGQRSFAGDLRQGHKLLWTVSQLLPLLKLLQLH